MNESKHVSDIVTGIELIENGLMSLKNMESLKCIDAKDRVDEIDFDQVKDQIELFLDAIKYKSDYE